MFLKLCAAIINSASMWFWILLQTDQFTDITRPGETLHGSKHVSLPLGAGFEDRSENHDILRPIVNIIVPNSKEDVFSPYSKWFSLINQTQPSR